MSLEAAIQENTAVLSELLKFWKNLPTTEAAAVAALQTQDDPQEVKPPAAKAKAEAPKSAAVSPPPETAAVSPASKPEESTSAPVSYDMVKTLILKLSGSKGREAAAGVLAGFGVAKGPDLKPEQYASAAKELEAALA